MSLRIALLGLLNQKPASGYELTQRFATGIGRYAWSAHHSQIYPELKKMGDEHLIEIVSEGARGSRTYAITEPGHEKLTEWLTDNKPDSNTVRQPFVLRLFLLSALQTPDATRMLEQVADHAAQQVDELSQHFHSTLDPELGIQSGGYAAAFGVYLNQAMHDWSQWAIGELTAGSDPGHTPTLKTQPPNEQ